jgi:hypothetical protein
MAEGRTPALQSFVEAFVGGNYVVAVNTITVTTSPTLVLSNSMERMAAGIVNVGATGLKITPTNTVSNTQGIDLGANGGNLVLVANEDLVMVGWDWWAQVPTGTTTVTVFTVTRYQGG